VNFMVVGKRIPPGRRLQVASVIRRFLRSDLLAHLKPSDDNQSQDSTDPVLPVFGESDDEVDSVTWREFQEEERERQAREARDAASKVKSLSKEEVAEAVQKAIEELEAKWEEKKKPKWELKAWKLWQDALRCPSRHTLIENARTRLRHLNDRLVKFSNEIIKSTWKTNEDISRQLGAWLEETVFQRKYEEWYINLVQSLRPPPKPETLPRVRKPKPKPQVLDDNSEELTSESDGLDGFIEYDEDYQMIDQFGDDIQVDDALGDAMDIDDASPQAEDGAEAPSSPPAMDQDDTATGVAQDEESDASLPEPSATPRKIKVEKSTEAAPATPVRFGTSPHQAIEIGSSPAPCEQAGSADGLPGFGDLESLQKIKDYGIPHWEEVKDGERLLVAVLCDWHEDELLDLHGTIQNRNHKELWAEFVQPVVEEGKRVTLDSMESIICRLFDVYFSKKAKRMNKPLRSTSCNRIRTNGEFFRSFCSHLKRVVSVLLGVSQPSNRVVIKTPRSSHRGRNVEDDIEDDVTDLEESSPDDAPISSTKKKRRRKRRDKGAADLRANITTFNEELERRARRAREQMASQGTVSSKQSRLIVNETKESDDLPFIYINDHIGAKIKDHQIEGVRFMWNQVVVHSKVRQGCLLAHTMGLGKTMQVITLLVVIAESSRSPDEGVRSQIPENLREGKTLILCPPSLLNNWEEEIHLWAPNGVLGPVNKLDGLTTGAFRKATVRAWAKNGGVLIIGYSLFSSLMLNSETPSLVVGDEAHYMKNPASQRHQATANFKTMNRIAMTGSPLTNNVMDYYSMINWVAPNYLADIAEFRERFANPIKEGLYMDSTPQQKRKARRMLHVLKATVEPKVHRRGIEVLVNELPKKKEFILTLPLTKVQDKLYREYVELAITPGIDGQMAQARAWSLVAHLSLVLAHPFVFKTHVEKQKAQAKSKNPKPRKSITTSESEDSSIELPQDILGTLLTTVNIRNIQDHELSNKIVILLRILEECRKVKDKVLVFSHSLGSLDFIEEIFKKNKIVYQRLDGSTTVSTRQDAVKKFNANVDSEVYLISTRAGGVGLNIHGANRVVIFDFKYTPADEQQAIGRAYRLGQTKPVYVYWLTVGGTFEDIIHNNGVFKTQLASRVVDKKNPIPWATRFSEYFSPPREVGQEDLSGARGLDKVLDALLDGPVGGLVRKITSTETFEREEVYELTPEEQQEAEKDIEMERLRSQNPEEYKRRERERAAIHAAIQQAVTTPVPIPQPPPQYRTPATGESQSTSLLPASSSPSAAVAATPPTPITPKPGTKSRGTLIKLKVPEHLRNNGARAISDKSGQVDPSIHGQVVRDTKAGQVDQANSGQVVRGNVGQADPNHHGQVVPSIPSTSQPRYIVTIKLSARCAALFRARNPDVSGSQY
jgi:SNF2 family DNA or RNA helicase